MPELPEVQAVCDGLKQRILNRVVEGITVREPRLRWPVQSEELARLVVGQKVSGVQRIAKYIVVQFQNEVSLLIHLGMSGRIGLVSADENLRKHDHVIFSIGDGEELRFNDPRRFGMVEAVETSKLDTHPRIENLGVEPFSSEFNAKAFYELSRGAKIAIKKFIMDSKRLVGVGNIFASESLFLAGMHPNTKAGRISRQRWEKLISSIVLVLTEAIKRGGTTIRDFENLDGDAGSFTQQLTVYGKEGEICFRCKRVIRKMIHSARSTYYCPGCQH